MKDKNVSIIILWYESLLYEKIKKNHALYLVYEILSNNKRNNYAKSVCKF